MRNLGQSTNHSRRPMATMVMKGTRSNTLPTLVIPPGLEGEVAMLLHFVGQYTELSRRQARNAPYLLKESDVGDNARSWKDGSRTAWQPSRFPFISRRTTQPRVGASHH